MPEPEQEKCGTTHYAGCACHEQGWRNKWEAAIDMAARAQLNLDEATERLSHAEILLGDLASEYWRSVLNDQDPSGEGIMGERVAQYWAKYDKASTHQPPNAWT